MMFLERAAARLETEFGTFQIEVFKDEEGKEHLSFTMGDLSDAELPVLTRLHSECMTGDTFFSTHCDCGYQLSAALAMIAKEGRGLLLYMRQEGRGIGLTAKIRAYSVQQTEGLDTFAANERLGLQADARDYSVACGMLKALGVSKVRLLTGNPAKVHALQDSGLEVVERVTMEIPKVSLRVQRYMQAKREIGGHL